MSINYQKHESYPDSILIRNFVGKVDVNDIINSWEYLAENKMINEDIKGVINNLIGCKLLLDMDSFTTLIAYLKENKPKVLSGEEKTYLSSLMQWYKDSKKKFDTDPEFQKKSQPNY